MQSSVSFEYSLLKHNAANPNRQRIAFDPNHNVQDDPMSEEEDVVMKIIKEETIWMTVRTHDSSSTVFTR